MNVLPNGWVATTIGDIADVQLGRQRSPEHHDGDHMRPYLRSANVTWNGINVEDVKEMNFDPTDAKKFELVDGDLLLNEASGSPNEVGKPAIWRGEVPGACFQNTLLRVRSRAVSTKYMYWYCYRSALFGEFGEAGRGVNIRHLGKRGLEAFPIPVAPAAEQQRIVAAVEEHSSHLDAAEASLRRAEASLVRLWTAELSHLFDTSWPRTPLLDLAVPQRPICYGILKPRTDAPGVVPYVEVRSLRGNRIDVESLELTSRELHAEFKRSELQAGDVVMAVRGSWDRAAVVPPELAGANVSRDVARIAPDSARLSPEYLALFLTGLEAARFFGAHARGVAVKGVNIGDLRRLPVPSPPLGVQEAVVDRAQQLRLAIERATLDVRRGHARSRSLRRSILMAAFSGDLVPQDAADETADALLERIQKSPPPTKPSRRKKPA